VSYGPGTEAQPKAVAATGDDAVAAAGDQAAADVAARAPGSPHAGSRREPRPRRKERGGRAGGRRESAHRPRPRAADAPAPAQKEKDSFEEIDYNSYFEDYLDSAYNPRQYQEEPEEFSLENILTRPEGLPEHLSWQLSMSEASPEVREIASYLIGNVDEDGYLRVSREEIRQAHYENDADIDAAMALVRSFDPSGVGASDLPDCLLLQLKALGIDNALIERINREHWPAFLNRQFAPLAKTLDVGMSEIQAAVEIIKNLEPKPGRKYSSERTIYVEPDVFVRKIDDEYVIQLSEDGLPKLRISAAYRKLLRSGNGVIGS
jgi:RNA polymerase sigma-54 factor